MDIVDAALVYIGDKLTIYTNLVLLEIGYTHDHIFSLVVEGFQLAIKTLKLHQAHHIVVTHSSVLVKPKWTRLIDNFHTQLGSYHH